MLQVVWDIEDQMSDGSAHMSSSDNASDSEDDGLMLDTDLATRMKVYSSPYIFSLFRAHFFSAQQTLAAQVLGHHILPFFLCTQGFYTSGVCNYPICIISYHVHLCACFLHFQHCKFKTLITTLYKLILNNLERKKFFKIFLNI
jgi:hypothetical protein